MAHKKCNEKCRVMRIIRYKKTNYQKSDVKRIHQLCQNGNDSKDLSRHNMFTRHHITQKEQEKLLPTDVPGTPSFGRSAQGLICFDIIYYYLIK